MGRHVMARPSGAATIVSLLRTSLTIAVGTLGALALLVVVAPAVGFRLVVIMTGSMQPTMPAGAIALTRLVPAEEITVGDVVTVARGARGDVTHRVVSREPAESFGAVSLVLQGDANRSPDAQPDVVRSAGLVIGSIPVGGQLVLLLRHPVAIASLSVAVALLVLWTWWPAPRHSRVASDRADGNRARVLESAR